MPGGRPAVKLSEELIEQLSSYSLTQNEIAAVCKCSVDTIQRNYHEPWERGQTVMKASLKRKQFEVALTGHVTMLIWLGKQHLGQRDNIDMSGDMTHKYYLEGPAKSEDKDEWRDTYLPKPKDLTVQ